MASMRQNQAACTTRTHHPISKRNSWNKWNKWNKESVGRAVGVVRSVKKCLPTLLRVVVMCDRKQISKNTLCRQDL
ncbi:Protein of unknown function [Pyronema omphalodes CBS 100304]|uniref:Uncharacterized protein n=1 Tax=Pyronema omphalodes (strain CBS 100304) TaxID=1076935 RepID=U4L149_PYROM|nr:Protein of unknown function [Pyronema omphalodes CBS 100304]